MLHLKHKSYKYALPLKNQVDCITTRLEKSVTTSKIYILRRSAKKLKNTFFSYDYLSLLLRQKPVELKTPLWKLEISMMLLFMFGLFFWIKKIKVCNKNKKNINSQNLK